MKSVSQLEDMVAAAKAVTDMKQWEILQQRIAELEAALLQETSADTPYNHAHEDNDLAKSLGRTMPQLEELRSVVKFWVFKCENISEVLDRIERSPVRLRDKLIMAWVFARMQGSGGGSGGDFADFMRSMMGRR